jgi:hypothetical protein
MCPFCKTHDGLPCTLSEKPGGRIMCACGRHAWPNTGAYLESCRRLSLTVTGQIHDWTQSY